MFRHLIFGSFLCFTAGSCTKRPPPVLTAEQAVTARKHFDRHLFAIGASANGIPHTAYQMKGVMEVIGEEGRNTFSLEQKNPDLYYIRISIAEVGVYERGHDGENFWERTPRTSRFLDPEEQMSLAPSVDFQRWKNHEKWYPEIQHEEIVEFGGERCTALTVETHDAQKEKLFFSEQSGLLLGIERLSKNPSITRYGQYLPQGDIRIPIYWEDKTGDVHRVWKVEEFEWDKNDVDFRPPPRLLEER